MALQPGPLVQVKAISKTYRRGHEVIYALRDISLDIKKGELIAIVGPSGSGKTTLAHAIGGLSTPTSGRVMINGQEIDTYSDSKLSKFRNDIVGFVFQNFSLIPTYSALENVMIPLIVAKVPRKGRKTRALQLLKLIGLEDRANQRANELSGGERQRVSIARALVHSPELIIADEPTGSLDSKRGDQIMTILETLAHKQHMTVVMVTHDERLAARADRIIHIQDGMIVKETHA